MEFILAEGLQGRVGLYKVDITLIYIKNEGKKWQILK